MTSLPVPIPSDFEITVKKGDKVATGDILAKKTSTSSDHQDADPSTVLHEIELSVGTIFNVSPERARHLLLKSPGDGIKKGDILAKRSRNLGMKIDEIISSIDGTIFKFDRTTGVLVLQTADTSFPDDVSTVKEECVYSPLEGTISVCHNDSIVIDSASDGLVGTKGIGGIGKGEMLIVQAKDGPVLATYITHD